jgi:hypothetical protein
VILADNAFTNLRVDDGRIIKLVLDRATLFLSIRDWQGDTLLIEFTDVIGIEGFGIVNVDLGGVNETSTDSLIEKACSIVEEPTAGFNCYSVLSAWNDRPLIRIVARSWKVEQSVTYSFLRL